MGCQGFGVFRSCGACRQFDTSPQPSPIVGEGAVRCSYGLPCGPPGSSAPTRWCVRSLLLEEKVPKADEVTALSILLCNILPRQHLICDSLRAAASGGCSLHDACGHQVSLEGDSFSSRRSLWPEHLHDPLELQLSEIYATINYHNHKFNPEPPKQRRFENI